MGLDPLEPIEQRVAERVGIGKARELGDAVQLLRLGGNDMGLLVADHLQPVLDAAQEEIGLGEVLGGAPARSSRPRRGAQASRWCRAF